MNSLCCYCITDIDIQIINFFSYVNRKGTVNSIHSLTLNAVLGGLRKLVVLMEAVLKIEEWEGASG